MAASILTIIREAGWCGTGTYMTSQCRKLTVHLLLHFLTAQIIYLCDDCILPPGSQQLFPTYRCILNLGNVSAFRQNAEDNLGGKEISFPLQRSGRLGFNL